MARLLIVDDHDAMREGMAVILAKQGHQVATARGGREGLQAYLQRPFDAVISDLKMDDLDGIELLKRIRAHDADAVVMVVTAHGSIEAAVDAMREGACDFITKPFPPDVLRTKVEKALELSSTRRQLQRALAHNQALEESVRAQGPLKGNSEPMRKLALLMEKAAQADATALICGESGTGKELVARQIHQLSPRRNRPFVAVHCAALAESLLESELFGHERGAFTGAVKRKLGRFELAEGGTLLLDEIGELSPSVQTKLLRVLQEKEIQRVGGEQSLKIDVRVLAATHRDLKQLVEKGSWREDLYYRLHVLPITVPPLRERPEDIALLAQHFVEKHRKSTHSRVRGLTQAANDALARYAWPGNVRELENAMEQALVFAEGEWLDEGDLPTFLRSAPPSLLNLVPQGDRPLPALLEDYERQLIQKAYEKAGGVKTETARLLGIKTSALYYKLEKYGFIAKNGARGEGEEEGVT
jgi:two-component system response regulator HydG